MKRTMKIGKGQSVTFEVENKNVYESVEDWKKEGERRFGSDVMKWKFKCPMCGHIASVEDFKVAGAEDPANSAYEECIGRYTGKGSPKEGDASGCNWAAYGLFGIPKGGTYVFTGPEQGAHIFDFAD
jgi:hypothetical protein